MESCDGWNVNVNVVVVVVVGSRSVVVGSIVNCRRTTTPR